MTMYAKVPEVTGLTVTSPRGKALYAENVRLTDATLEGTVVLSYVEADINSIKTWFPGKALYAQYGTHARVRRMEANLANADYPYNDQNEFVSSAARTDSATLGASAGRAAARRR